MKCLIAYFAVRRNEGSRTLILETPTTQYLLWGDAEAEGLQAMLPHLPASDNPTYLLLPHHGSDTPHITPLLQLTSPTKIATSVSSPPQLTDELRRNHHVLTSTHSFGPMTWP